MMQSRRQRISVYPRVWSALVLACALSACTAARDSQHSGSQPDLSQGASAYKRACAMCHDGQVSQAPRMEALALMPVSRIEAAMDGGIMKMQAAQLSPQERAAVAQYLSRASITQGEEQGRCPPGDIGKLTPVHIRDWGMSEGNSRAIPSSTTSVNASNVARLRLAWAFGFPGGTRARVQPTIAGDTLFTADQSGTIYALDTTSGCIRWTASVGQEIRSSLVIGSSSGEAATLYFGDISGRVHAFDIKTRTLKWSVRPEAHPQSTITGTLRLHEGRLFVPVSSLEVVAAMDGKYACCTFRGAIAALDAGTGAVIWKTYTVDQPASPQGVNRDGAALFGPSGAPVWASPTIDSRRSRIYVGTGENYSHPATDKSDAILALDMASGKIVWRFQALAQDVWNAACSSGANCPVATGPDYDFGAPPVLATLPGDRDVLLAGQKSGFVYALDPDRNGRLLWREKPGRGGIMGGVHWGMTSDGSTLYAPISDLSVYPSDAHLPAQSGLQALDVSTGAKLWAQVLPDRCGKTQWRCSPGVSAAATLLPGVVLGGSLDGMLRAFSTRDGAVLWSFDTNRDFEAVNGVKAFGGGIDSSGPIAAGPFVFATSGYDKFGQKAGNVLLAFRLDEQSQ